MSAATLRPDTARRFYAALYSWSRLASARGGHLRTAATRSSRTRVCTQRQPFSTTWTPAHPDKPSAIDNPIPSATDNPNLTPSAIPSANVTPIPSATPNLTSTHNPTPNPTSTPTPTPAPTSVPLATPKPCDPFTDPQYDVQSFLRVSSEKVDALLDKDSLLLRRIASDTSTFINIPPQLHRIYVHGSEENIERAKRAILDLAHLDHGHNNDDGPVVAPASEPIAAAAAAAAPTVNVRYESSRSLLTTPGNPGATPNLTASLTKLHSTSVEERQHLHLLTPLTLSAIKTETGVETITLETTPKQGRTINIQGTISQIRAAIAKVRHILREAILAETASSLRRAMRCVPSPVAVLTTQHPSLTKPTKPVAIHPSFRGMALSSFTTVTLTPIPIISLNIRCPSRTYDALLLHPYFNLHVLAANTIGRSIASAFTKPHADPTQPFLDLQALKDVHFYAMAKNLPRIGGSGVQVRMACRVLEDKTVTLGDHVVVFAEVQSVNKIDEQHTLAQRKAYAKQTSQSVNSLTGLSYVHGTYSRPVPLTDFDMPPPQTRRVPATGTSSSAINTNLPSSDQSPSETKTSSPIIKTEEEEAKPPPIRYQPSSSSSSSSSASPAKERKRDRADIAAMYFAAAESVDPITPNWKLSRESDTPTTSPSPSSSSSSPASSSDMSKEASTLHQDDDKK